jgi:hypothetical protein
MIPNICPLSDKYKLQTTLKTECLLEKASSILNFCKECPYSAENKKAKIATANYENELIYWLKLAGILDNDDTKNVSDKR